MSNIIGRNVLHQSLLCSTVFEHQSNRHSSGIPANSLFQAVSINQPAGASAARKSPLSTKFYGTSLNARPKMAMGRHRPVLITPRAVLAVDSASEQLAGKFNLEGNVELQITVGAPTPGSLTQVNIEISYSSNSLLLHWGAIRDKKEKWVLPSRQPDGTKNYKNRALRTPFVSSASKSFVKIEIDDPAIVAVEFLILDEAQNKWFKNNGANFHVKLPIREELIQNVSVPEDLVQTQAYLRWERKGKQIYTPEQEKEEYEAARTELLEEIVRGTSVEDLRAKLTNKNDRQEIKESSSHGTKNAIPDDLVQIQSYIRWERAGKPNYSADQQLREFEEAKKELQSELEKGISLDEIRKKITKGEIQTKVSDQLKTKKYFRTERIQRKQRDFMQILNKHVAEPTEKKNISVEPKALTPVELFVKATEEQEGDSILNKKIYKLADKELLVLVHKPVGKTKIHLATDFKEPLILHWALSKKAGEWLAPPPSVLPAGSVSLSGSVETTFTTSSLADLPYQVQSIEIEIEEEGYVGMPFVLQSGGNWIKNKGSDFYVDFSYESKQVQQDFGDGKGTAKALLGKIAGLEIEAQKSFMHRFNIAADLIQEAKEAGELGFAGILVWMRFMATRQLIWNKNYNVKPREISKAQDRLTDLLQNVYISNPEYREIVRMILSTVGRGGEGDVGQRIRDEILVIQRNNNCKGGMMEEWHQKLHNNTSPDDVIICQALIDYIKSDFDISAYWKTLNDNGITKERLLSYDRAIHSEPNFRRDQKDGLLRDLGNYMRTLKAVHSGADLESAITNCLGYRSEGQGFMVGVQINPIPNLPSGFPELLQFVSEHVEDRNVEALLEGLLEARQEIRPLLCKHNDRLKDLLFLDIALESSVRTAIERGYEELNEAGPEKIMYFVSLILENLTLSSDDNEDLIYCLKVDIFTEEMIRAGSAAALSLLLNRLDPVLRKTASLGSWQVISPVEVFGYVAVVDELLAVQDKSYDRPTILLARRVKGEEEIPDGTVAVLTADMPDVLSHVSVRARNCKVCFATCFDPNILADLQSNEGKMLHLKPTSADIAYSVVEGSELQDSSSANLKEEDGPSSSVTLVKKQFAGKYAITSDEFTGELVGAKSRNIAYLKGKVPSWIGIPTSVALPFGVFEKVLSDNINQAVAEKLQILKQKLGEEDHSALREIRETVLQMKAPNQLNLFQVQELKTKMKSSGMPWPGDEGEQRWEQAWMAMKKVWASKWNERAFFSTRRVKLDHEYLCMAVLVQEIINADYAFVIHTTNPSSGDSSEIYAEVVKGLGETLVGAYPGRALSFVCKKNDLKSPRVLGYPSKPIGLFIRRSIIFRSDSNGEDLEGYAGAGLYDSVPMDEAEKVVLDYSSDRLITDGHFQQSILSSIARAGCEIEELFGSAQDIEGVVRDGKIYVVQTRPQM
ncbi:alpha-glucan water dikinase, chloroplastic isoform X5 [Citrus clementina]|uniref:alpha-glucan water dikinase, chloroplastic isoform X5 n=1 Tax=Citrus clementina TaxID=85681 RepID=UPI000CED029C|nr:alpha-glucan water dikinase, chloroplastic isoform X5 [Citrus x clementina]